ncbi:MAG TPA: hypothetical protein DDZ90_22735 [Planctomycetaceae bacterium]|nr:hypothetical protein [Gimesia sp.]HBL46203.1 hypothetical protein [Planctomycetaceae bacterium]
MATNLILRKFTCFFWGTSTTCHFAGDEVVDRIQKKRIECGQPASFSGLSTNGVGSWQIRIEITTGNGKITCIVRGGRLFFTQPVDELLGAIFDVTQIGSHQFIIGRGLNDQFTHTVMELLTDLATDSDTA